MKILQNGIQLNEKEERLIAHVLDELTAIPTGELNKTFGSVTIEEIRQMAHALNFRDFFRRNGIEEPRELTDEEAEQEHAYRYEG